MLTTKDEAEATLAKLPLKSTVVVADTTSKTGAARRRYSFTLPTGNVCEVEIDAEPSEQQLADLAKHLPLDEKDKAAALEAMKAEPIKVAEPAPTKPASK
jgi:hypothetical protein